MKASKVSTSKNQVKKKLEVKTDNNLINRKRKRGNTYRREEKGESFETFADSRETSLKRKSSGENESHNSNISKKNKINKNISPQNYKWEEKFIRLISNVEKEEKNKKIQSPEMKDESKSKNDHITNSENYIQIRENNFKRTNHRKRRINKKSNKSSFQRYLDRFFYKKTNKTFSSLKQEIRDLKQKINDDHEAINDCNKTINDQKKEILTQNVKISLLSKILNLSEQHSKAVNAYVMNLGTQFNALFNSCKVLFVRKICDFLLEGLTNKLINSMAITKARFKNNNGVKFQLIVFKKNIKGISKFKLNLIIDYLMETKQNCSSIIHMNRVNEISKPIMKEIFTLFVNKSKNPVNNNDYNLTIQEMTEILFKNENVVVENYEEEKENKEEEEEENEKDVKSGQEDGNDDGDDGDDEEDREDEEDRKDGEDKENKEELNPLYEKENLIEEEENNSYSDNEKNEGEEMNDEDASHSKINVEEIKRLIPGKPNHNIQINDLVKMLKEKEGNKKKGIREIALKVKQIINPSYFYDLWIQSFKNEKYKQYNSYKQFVDIDYTTISSKEMNDILMKLLPDYKINFFNEDPSKFSKNIKMTIYHY